MNGKMNDRLEAVPLYLDTVNCILTIEIIGKCIYCICRLFVIPARLIGGGVPRLGRVSLDTTASVKVVYM